MAGIRKWIHGKIRPKPQGKGKEEQPLPQEPLPFLPATRPRLLSQESVPSDGDPEPSRSLENYGLLGRLPYEVRHQILVEAFGGRRLHVDLSYSHPLVRKPPKAKTSGSGSGAISGYRHCGLGSELVCDSSRPEGWQWFGCVCHRRAGFSETETQQRYDAGEYSQSIEPCDDDCLDGTGSMCSCGLGQPGRDGAACFVGVMGWLLACRQAYSDGVEVLYGTNILHMSSLDLQVNLPHLVPPCYLEMITSLELLWPLSPIEAKKGSLPLKNHVAPLWDASSGSQGQAESPLHVMCDMIPQTFPRLCSLYISFQCWLDWGSGRAGDDLISRVETIFLGPLEDMLRACVVGRSGQMECGRGYVGLELNVAIQRGAWFVLLHKYHKLLGPKLKVESVDALSRGRFWKPLRRGSGAMTVEGDGTGASHEMEDDDDGFGYWICGGWEDVKVFGGADYWLMTNWGDSKWMGVKETY